MAVEASKASASASGSAFGTMILVNFTVIGFREDDGFADNLATFVGCIVLVDLTIAFYEALGLTKVSIGETLTAVLKPDFLA